MNNVSNLIKVNRYNPFVENKESLSVKPLYISKNRQSVYENKDNILSLDFKINEYNIIQFCDLLNIDIPRFCYHEKLSIAGNCRMCLVEVQKSLKPVASCALPLLNSMSIRTDTSLVKQCRENVLEFLLINHPLDCPICDQGGECDLQDQTLFFGTDRGRFYEYKRAVSNKEFGPLIKTFMTRCIHCTRCVRFLNEIAGISTLGVTGRGMNMEISTYLERYIFSEVSGNIIDLCPVGALTAKPYAFQYRSWELKKIYCNDIMDVLGSRIAVYFFNRKIKRILPSLSESLNEIWISDRTRFFFDSLYKQRLNIPLINLSNFGFKKVSWFNALKDVNDLISFIEWGSSFSQKKAFYDMQFFVSELSDLESLSFLKTLGNYIGFSNFSIGSFVYKQYNDLRMYYIWNFKSIQNLRNFDIIFLLGCNPRYEAPIINLNFRKNFLKNHCLFFSIGYNIHLTYNVLQLGNNLSIYSQFLHGNCWGCNLFLQKCLPLFIIGYSFLQRKDSLDLLDTLYMFCYYIFNTLSKELDTYASKKYNSFDILLLPFFISSLSFLEISFVNNRLYNFSVNFDSLFDSNNFVLFNLYYYLGSLHNHSKYNISKANYVIYQGHHAFDSLMKYVNVVLPGCIFLEKTSSFLNILGNLQKNKSVFFPFGDSRKDWEILFFISYSRGFRFDFLENISLDVYWLLNKLSPYLNSKMNLDNFTSRPVSFFENMLKIKMIYKFSNILFILNTSFDKVLYNPFIGNFLCSFSEVLQKCSYKFSNTIRSLSFFSYLGSKKNNKNYYFFKKKSDDSFKISMSKISFELDKSITSK